MTVRHILEGYADRLEANVDSDLFRFHRERIYLVLVIATTNARKKLKRQPSPRLLLLTSIY